MPRRSSSYRQVPTNSRKSVIKDIELQTTQEVHRGWITKHLAEYKRRLSVTREVPVDFEDIPLPVDGDFSNNRRHSRVLSSNRGPGSASVVVTDGLNVGDTPRDVASVFDRHVRRKSLSAITPLDNRLPDPVSQDISSRTAGGFAQTHSTQSRTADASLIHISDVPREGTALREIYVDTNTPLVTRALNLKVYHCLATTLTVVCIGTVILAQAAFNERVIPLLVNGNYSNLVQTVIMTMVILFAALMQLFMRKRSIVCEGGTKQYATISVVLMVVVHSIVKDIDRDESSGLNHVYVLSRPTVDTLLIPAEVGIIKAVTVAAYGAAFSRFIPYLSLYSTYKIGGVAGFLVIGLSLLINFLPITWPPLFHQNLYHVFLGSLSFFYFAREYIQTKSDAIAERHQNIVNYCKAIAAITQITDATAAVEAIASEPNKDRRLTLTDEYLIELQTMSNNLKRRLKRPSGGDAIVAEDVTDGFI